MERTMCGLVGIIKHIRADQLIRKVLNSLQYRGYDSWGYVVTHKSLSVPNVFHSKLSIDEDYTFLPLRNVMACGIGHTRWATHGKNDLKYAHPIHNEKYDFYIVHNGIYKNDNPDEHDTQMLLKAVSDELDKLWVELQEETWGAPLSDYEILTAINRAMEGNEDNAALFSFANYPDKIYGYAKTRPLFMDEEGNLCSDVRGLSVIGSNLYMRVENGAFVVDEFNYTDKDLSFGIFYRVNTCGEALPKLPKIADTTEYDMLREIREQSVLTHGYDIPLTNPVFIGCGSSYYAGKFAKIFYRRHGFPADAEYASEIVFDKSFVGRDLVFVTQSGETQDVIAKMHPALKSILVTNNPHASAKKWAQSVYYIDAGPEISVAATKTFFKTALALCSIGDLDADRLQGYLEKNIPIWEKVTKEMFEKLYEFDRCLFLGTGYTYPLAQEAALKMKEVAQIPSEGIPAAEIKHGPIALADERTLCVVLAEPTGSISDNIAQLKARNAQIFVVDDVIDYDYTDYFIDGAYYELAKIIPCQFLAYYTAVARNLNPDRPRNLAKTVTV